MSGTILTGPAGSGKTSYVIDRILETEEAAFWNEIWVLLPTRLQNEAFRDKLLERARISTVFNIRFFEFYELYDTVLDLAGSPQRTIRQAASDRILRYVIDDLLGRKGLPYYAEIAGRPGFVKLVSGFIKELKQGLVLPEDFTQVVLKRDLKDRDLTRIYRGYQDFLMQSGLVDRDGAGWVAEAELRRNPELARHIRLLVVDGFDSFTPLQVRLLTALAGQVDETLLTLTYEAHRTGDAARVFARTLDNLLDAGNWTMHQHEISAQLPRSEALAHLERNLFALDVEAAPAEDALRLITAPDPRDEARAVLRRVKGLLLDGVHPEDIAIVIRDVDLYADVLRSTAAAYGLPVVVRQSEQLTQNPAVKAVLQLLDLHSLDYPRRQMLDVLYSPYLTAPEFSPVEIDELARVSLERPIVAGQEAWLEGLSAKPGRDEDGEARYEASDPEALLARTRAFFARATPPASALAREYVAWIEDLLGPDPAAYQQDEADLLDEQRPPPPQHFDLYGQIRQNSDAAVAVRDLYALQGLRGALSEVLGAYDLLADMTNNRQPISIHWADFRADLELAIRERTISDEAHRSRVGRVLITTVFEARGLPHDHLFIMGLSEGIFPARQPEDPLYSDAERESLNMQGVHIETAAGRNKDQGLFYEMCALAQQTLTLSRPTRDDGGNEWAESVFWKRAAEVLYDAPEESLRVGAVPLLEKAASQRELIVSVSHALNQSDALTDPALTDTLLHLTRQRIWANVLRGREIELAREATGLPFDRFSGVLRDPALLAEVQHMLGPEKIWSATQFNDLGLCAFRFFSRRLLKLEPYEEPESGLDALQLGSLNHKILEETYERFRAENLSIHEENAAAAEEILREEAARILATAPQDFGFHTASFWEQEKENILGKLVRLVRLDFSPESPISKLIPGENRVPLKLEAGFGYDGAPLLEIDGLLARGFIDRMDESGGGVVIVDYKSGSSTPTKKDMEDGRNYQMLLYLLAARQLLADDLDLRGGLFWSIQRNAEGGQITAEDEVIEVARQSLQQQVMAARKGHFPNQPARMTNGKCAHYCEFSRFCRVTRANLRKSVGG